MQNEPGTPAPEDPSGPEVARSGERPDADEERVDDDVGDEVAGEVVLRLHPSPGGLPVVDDGGGLAAGVEGHGAPPRMLCSPSVRPPGPGRTEANVSVRPPPRPSGWVQGASRGWGRMTAGTRPSRGV